MNTAFSPRKFQRENLAIARAIAAGDRIRKIVNVVTPGGGKSTIPVIYASQLIPREITKIAWFTPRVALGVQGEQAFQDRELRAWLGHTLEIRACDGNETDPSRGTAGYVSTHQALTQDPDFHRQEFERFQYALVIDEPHHIEEGSDQARAFQSLVDRAQLVILMTGTLMRHNQQRIAFVDYVASADGREEPQRDSSETATIVHYTRADALQEHAIIPIEFTHLDMTGQWERGGTSKTIQSFDDTTVEKDARDAIATALATEYAIHLLDRCVRDWIGYRQDNSRAQLLIVGDTQARAHRYRERVIGDHAMTCRVATMDEGKAARGAIQAFRARRVPALSTVGMAYEGMDARGITHIAGLLRYRSVPYIEQMLGRGTRYDPLAGPWASQRCYAYVPDDPIMRQVIADIEDTQGPYIREKEATGCGVGGGPRDDSDFLPLNGLLSGFRASELNGDALDRDATTRAQTIIDQFNMAGRMTPLVFTRMAQAYRTEPIVVPAPDPSLTISELEDRERQYIEAKCRKIDQVRFELRWGTANGELWKVFRKRRPDMTLAELRRCRQYIDRKYPDISIDVQWY